MSVFITFNPKYTIKPNKDQVVLLTSASTDFDNVFSIIHPIHAMILCCIDGRPKEEIVQDISRQLQIETEVVEDFIKPLINNQEDVFLKHDHSVVKFPPMTIVYSNQKPYRTYSVDQFIYTSVDLRYKRLVSPARITFMVNNVCKTNCYYCYADRRFPQQSTLPFDRIKGIIQEAFENHVISINTIGGEFFLYPYWKELTVELKKYDYPVSVSTKLPLDRSTVEFIKDQNLSFLQISLDTLIKSHLLKIIGVREAYYDEMKETFRLLEKAGVKVAVHTILNRYNDSLEDMKSLFDFLSRFSNIQYWRCDLVGASLYNSTPIENMEPDPARHREIASYLTQLKETAPFMIYPIAPPAVTPVSGKKENKYDKFMNRGFCSGNFSTLFILPDGKVTICEELYWHPHFIIGDLSNQSLAEVWNSKKAVEIYQVDQKSIPPDSLCHACEIFSECRSFKQVCYKKILKVFGYDKWYYPDPDCPFVEEKQLE